MSGHISLTSYLMRDSLMRWRGRLSSPFSRLSVAVCLSVAALLVLASLSMGINSLQKRIQQFGLNSLVVRSPMGHASDPVPAFHHALSNYGHLLNLRLAYAHAQVNLGDTATLAFSDVDTPRELADLGIEGDRLPILLTSRLPSGILVRANIGPWWVEAQTAAIPSSLNPTGLSDILIARESDFPMQSQNPGQALTLLTLAPAAPPMGNVVAALQEVTDANPSNSQSKPTIQSALPLLRSMDSLQMSWQRYMAMISSVLALTIATVFGASAILEYEITVYTSALLRSFGASRIAIWMQRYIEAALLANLGGLIALIASHGISRAALPQLTPHLWHLPTAAPLIIALNVGALLASLPVGIAMRRRVGLVLQ